MEQRVWVYRAGDNTFWIAREPVLDPSAIPAPRPVLEIGMSSVEVLTLAKRTQDQLGYAGVAPLTEWDAEPIILSLEPPVSCSRLLGPDISLTRRPPLT